MYFCNVCGGETTKWSGKCPHCNAWNSLREITSIAGKNKNKSTKTVDAIEPLSLDQIKLEKQFRLKTSISELDGVLGGGIVPGMVCLIGGEPGIGKSTLMLQVANQLASL